MSTPIVEIEGVSRTFVHAPDLAGRALIATRLASAPKPLQAVAPTDLAIREGEVMALVGESGCGKSTLGRMLAGLLQPSSGSVRYFGKLLAQTTLAERLAVQMIFQNPFAALNPRMRVADALTEAPLAHGLIARAQATDCAARLLEQVGLDTAYASRYPHQFSGGQRARIGIARALAVKPKFLICDEAVAALDVSIQAQVLNLFSELRRELGLTYLFISHDLGVVRYLADRVAIMYLGRIVEQGPAEAVFESPHHPYTQALLTAAPRLDRRHVTFSAIEGELPSPLDPPSGCHFHPRCPHAFERCRREAPRLVPLGGGRESVCHLSSR